MKEIWKDIPGYETLYQVSNLGNIRSLHNYGGKYNILRQQIKRGYYQVGLRKNGIRKWHQVHRLVAGAFLCNKDNLPQVNHKNENKLDNRVENLEWCSVSYNNTYGTRIEKVKNKISKPVIQFSLDGKYIKEYPSLCDAARTVNSSAGNIYSCCNKKPNYKQVKGYIWRYKSEVMLNANRN